MNALLYSLQSFYPNTLLRVPRMSSSNLLYAAVVQSLAVEVFLICRSILLLLRMIKIVIENKAYFWNKKLVGPVGSISKPTVSQLEVVAVTSKYPPAAPRVCLPFDRFDDPGHA